MFNIDKFNELINAGDIYGLDYIRDTIINKLDYSKDKMDRNDYLRCLLSACIDLNTCVDCVEHGNNITENNVYNKYHDIMQLLLKELNIYWNNNTNRYELDNKLYINVYDYQGTTWALGQVGTIQYWKELALEWCDSDESWEMYDFIKKHENNEDLLGEISCHWDIEIVEFDENNEEHVELRRQRENRY